MERIKTATREVDKFGTGRDGFTDGNVTAGVSSTQLEADWFDQVQEEIARAIELENIALDPTDMTQLHQAIGRIAATVASAYVLKAGDTMTGGLGFTGAGVGIGIGGVGAGISYAAPSNPTGGTWATNNVAFGWDGANLRLRIDDTDIGSITPNVNAGSFVLKTGDTMTGPLQVNSNISAQAAVFVATAETANDFYLARTAPHRMLRWVGNWYDSFQEGVGRIWVTEDVVGMNLGVGNLSISSNMTAAGYFGAATNFSGQMASGSIATGPINCSTLGAGSDITCINMTGSGNVSGGALIANTAAGQMAMAAGFSGLYMQYIPAWFWDFAAATGGNLTWNVGGLANPFLHLEVTSGEVRNDRGPMAANGAYRDFSDRRLKHNITDAPYGLQHILQLNPVKFERAPPPPVEINSRVVSPTSPQLEIGFIADELQTVIPEAISKHRNPDGSDDPVLGYASSMITAVLVNAVKELSERLNVLEGRHI